MKAPRSLHPGGGIVFQAAKRLRQGNAFLYRARLQTGGALASYDFKFIVYDYSKMIGSI